MSPGDFNHLLNSVTALSPEQMRQLHSELERKMTATTNIAQPVNDPFLGSMKDHVKLIDEIVEEAMQHREQQGSGL
jgi:hypothetical protein